MGVFYNISFIISKALTMLFPLLRIILLRSSLKDLKDHQRFIPRDGHCILIVKIEIRNKLNIQYTVDP